jgi:SAM-dependent methyltransferase
MPNGSIDVDAFNAFEKQGWQQTADPYDRYFGRLTAQAGATLLDLLDSSPEDKALLDLATGPGYLALLAARIGYRPVLGIDFSDAMVTLARQAAAACASAAQFKSGNAEALAEADHSFDTVTMNFGLLHLGQPQQAIMEARRVLRPSGRFGFTVWAGPQRSTGFSIILAAIDTFADKTVPIPPGPPFFHFSDPMHSIAAMQIAGFTQIEVTTIDLVWALDSSEALFDAFLHGTARTGGLLRAQTRVVLDAVRQSVIRDTEKYKSGTGIRIPMSVVLVTGTK